MLFWIGCAAYAVNRWVLKPIDPNPFLHSHFADLWLVPCALPLILYLHQRMGWRDDGPPTRAEIVAHLLPWSVLFEWVGPHFWPHATADAWDVVCYATGGLIAWLWWHRAPRPAPIRA